MRPFFVDVKGFLLIPYMSHGNGPRAKGGKLVSDTLLPVSTRRGRIGRLRILNARIPRRVKKRVLANWAAWGFRSEE